VSRRANGEGSVYQRADGRWVGALSMDEGRRRMVYAATQREARAKLRELQRQLEDGVSAPAGKALTLGSYLDTWVTVTLQSRVTSGRLKASTADSYGDFVRQHIAPTLGRETLTKLTPAKVRWWMAAKQGEVSARGTPRSARSVAYYHSVLRKALADAVRDELVRRNVAALVEPPVATREKVTPLAPAEARALLAAAADDRLGVLWLTMLAVGLRRGEALGLHWDDLDLEVGSVTIRRSLQRVRGATNPSTGRRTGRLEEVEPKTQGSAATIAIPEHLAAALREHRCGQLAERLAAIAWVDRGLVFSTPIGTPLEPRNINRAWDELCDRAGVRRLRVHDLRHASATFMLAAGVDLKVIQATLRHSRLSTTADVYAHVLDEVQRQAADRMDGVLRNLSLGS
jgi:integrase